MSKLLLAICFVFVGLLSQASSLATSAGSVSITIVADGLDEPWGMTFLPNGDYLVTERGGQLLLGTNDGNLKKIHGVPNVSAKGQGGLLDVMVPNDFAISREIFLSFAVKQGRGTGTALAVARLSDDGKILTNLRVLFEMSRGSSGGKHFGSRIVEGRDGTIFLTVGERGDRDAAQDLTRHNGSVIRINRDGSVPDDNPYVDQNDAQPEIWSYGHRNPQGAALDLRGNLWVSEHGARGGDEINQIRPGANFGWPIIAYGRHYSGQKIGVGTSKPGMEQPVYFWDPSIAPSGLMIYSGKLWPQWRGNFFIGSLKFDYLSRLEPGSVWAEEVLQSPEMARVRDVREAPDGSIWFISEDRGAIFKIAPE